MCNLLQNARCSTCSLAQCSLAPLADSERDTENSEVSQDVLSVCPESQACSDELTAVSDSDGEIDKGENPCELNVNLSFTDDVVRVVEGNDMDKANSEGSVNRAELSVPMGSLEPKVSVQ